MISVAHVAHAMGSAGDAPPLTRHTALTVWQFAPAVTVGVIALGLCYLALMWRVGRDHPARPWPWARAFSFMAGLGVVAVATQSSIGAYDDVLFWMHMWQHLLLLMVAPPLLLLGQPITLLLHASRNPTHSLVKRVVRSRIVSAVTFPLVGAGLYIATVVGTHLTSFMNLVLTHPLVHDGEHILYLLAGYLYFLPLIGREPIKWRLSFPTKLFLLVLAMPVDTFTGVVLNQANHELFPAYIGRRDWGPTLVGDLHAGGAVMWIGGDAIMLVMIVALFAGVLRGRTQLDAGRWLESARAYRFDALAASGSGEGAGSAEGASSVDALAIGATDSDDARLAAYNAYLARLDSGGGHRSGSGS
jgi:cytochrome c oxidase assembly factor CtaG